MTDEEFLALKAPTSAPPPTLAPPAPPATSNPFADKIRQLTTVAAANNAENPGGFDATTGRIITGAVTGLPDLAVSGYNAVARGTGGTELPLVGPQVNRALGGADMPADASVLRQLLEGGASAALGGGASATARAAMAAPTLLSALGRGGATAASTIVGPTVGSHYGGQTGAAIANTLKLDPETGALLGSLLGGTLGAGKSGYDRYSHNWYANRADPNAPAIAGAWREEGLTPTAGALGGADIKAREKLLAGEPGASNYTSQRIRGARQDVGSVIDRAAQDRGATMAQPEPGDIGADVANIANRGARNLQARGSAQQQALQDRIGARTGTDIQSVLDAMNQVGQSTDRLTRAPIEARVNALRADLPRDPQTGDITSYELPYEVVKDARTGTRVAGEGYGAVPARHAQVIEDAMTGAMRDTAAQQGVNPATFDRIQQRYAASMGEGGPFQTLDKIGDPQRPMPAYQFLRQGEQNPGNLRTLQATGLPEVDAVLGNYIRMMGNKTINAPAVSRGPIRFANQWEGLTQGARDVIGGTELPRLDNAAIMARSLDYPPSQLGTSKMLGGALGQANENLVLPASVGAMAGHIDPSLAGPAALLARYAKPVVDMLRARGLQSSAALNALAGRPPEPLNIAPPLTAAGVQLEQRDQRGPRRQ